MKPYERSGLVFEEKFAKYAKLAWGGDKEIWQGRWLKYRTNNGKWYWAQPDVVMLDHEKKTCIIFECKLSYRPVKAFRQLSQLYLPLLQELYSGYKFRLVQVFRHGATKRCKPELLIEGIEELQAYEEEETVYAAWNWFPPPL